jgi:hypothetical protein
MDHLFLKNAGPCQGKQKGVTAVYLLDLQGWAAILKGKVHGHGILGLTQPNDLGAIIHTQGENPGINPNQVRTFHLL